MRKYWATAVFTLAPRPTTTEVAELLGIDQTTATRTLALIKKAGLAIDTRGRDRRERRWGLTEEGEAMWRKLKPAWDQAQSAFEKRLGRAEAAALKKACYSAASQLGVG